MAASTTVKVATQTGAAKDDVITASASGLTEDTLTAKLNVLANDPGAAKLYSLTQNTAGLASAAQFPVTTSATLASGAKITINADGTIGYDASALQASLQSYALGETFTDTFVYTVRMANGALSTAKVTVSIAGANDAPTLAAVEPVSIFDTAADDSPAAVEGVLAGADMDHGAVLTYGFAAGVDYAVVDGKLVSTNAYGTLTLDAQTGAYSFVADAGAIDALAEGVNAAAAFAVTVTDEHGAAANTTSLTFNMIGANDTAEFGGDTSGSIAEDGVLSASGTLSVSDRDSGQSGFAAPDSLEGAYGTFTFDTASGAWTYTLHNDDASVQALNAAQTVFDELIITSLDGSASETIRVSIAGADEPASGGTTPSKPVDPSLAVTKFKVNYGQTDVNGKQYIENFDGNDLLTFSNNYTFTGITKIDTNNDGILDSSTASFNFQQGPVTVVLVGYLDLTTAQIPGAV